MSRFCHGGCLGHPPVLLTAGFTLNSLAMAVPTNQSDTSAPAEIHDPWMAKFLTHLAADRGASVYTQRNYAQALHEFYRWQVEERGGEPQWDTLQRDDFRGYLRFLGRGRLSRAATRLRFSALRTFYKFLMRHGAVAELPIKNISLPKLEKRLPRLGKIKRLDWSDQ